MPSFLPSPLMSPTDRVARLEDLATLARRQASIIRATLSGLHFPTIGGVEIVAHHETRILRATRPVGRSTLRRVMVAPDGSARPATGGLVRPTADCGEGVAIEAIVGRPVYSADDRRPVPAGAALLRAMAESLDRQARLFASRPFDGRMTMADTRHPQMVKGAPRSYLPPGTADSPDARAAAGAPRRPQLSAAGMAAAGDVRAVAGHGLAPRVATTGGAASYQAPGARRCYRVGRAKSAPTVATIRRHVAAVSPVRPIHPLRGGPSIVNPR